MEINEKTAEKPASYTHQSHWLQETISGVDEKMKAILDLLEDDDAERKQTITEAVRDLCISYRSLAEEYEGLKSTATDVNSFESSSPLNNRSIDAQLEAIGSDPESTMEDIDIECEGTMTDLEHMKIFADNSGPKYGSNMKPENPCSDGARFKLSKLVEENTQLQVELIRRNSEKRETIIKLQNQVRRLKAENDTLQRTVSFFDRNKQHIQEKSPSRKAMLMDKIFKGCSP